MPGRETILIRACYSPSGSPGEPVISAYRICHNIGANISAYRICRSIKQAVDEFVAREAMMRGNRCKNSGERAHSERVVFGDGDVVFAKSGACQP